MVYFRSNGSVATYTEPSGASGAEMFYDPRQSTVARKFFRKQRRQMRQNNLGTRRSGDGGLLNSDGEYPKVKKYNIIMKTFPMNE